ncbi:alpha/beta hydrolase family protein [Phenylobacterium immobile]|uniref:alpha/beta hydrolase family protein n=1 Tax=Phenylobacterium immobile TaxID=21 RepID=UPI000B1C4F43|nr:S9 family peptidase [Phenylobacterium immobile]
MRFCFGRLFAGLCAAVALSCAAAAAPLEVYGRLPRIEDVAMAPDGAHLALTVTNGEAREVVVQQIADMKIVKRMPVGETKLRDLTWGSPNHLIITWSRTGTAGGVIAPRQEWPMALVVDVKNDRARSLMEGVNGMNVIYRSPDIRVLDGKPYAFVNGVSFPGSQGVLTVFRIDLNNVRQTRVTFAGSLGTRNVVVDEAGEAVAESVYDDRAGRWRLRLKSSDIWTEVLVVDAPIDGPSLLGMGRDGASVLVSTDTEDGAEVREVALKDGAQSAALAKDATSFIHDPVSRRLIGFVHTIDGAPAYTFFDPADQRLWRGVAAAFPGDLVRMISWSNDRTQVVVRVDSPKDGPAYALVDRNKHTAVWLGPEYRDLTPSDVAEKRTVSFKAADGLALAGYLTLPRGRAEKALPLVVFPHGGPAVRDMPGFDWWAQAMASRGYAVLQVNYRGSDGVTRSLLEAGYGQWGRKMQTDLSDGVRYLAGQGVIDPKRVCIVGASYGGYAALAGATLDRGVYRCAASVAGPADLKRMVGAYRVRRAQRYWTRFMGADDAKDPDLSKISPSEHAGEVEIPLLMIHGRDDTVVPLEQSQIMARALEKAGKPSELVVLPGEDHWLTTGTTRQAMLTSVVTFLEKHNPPH